MVLACNPLSQTARPPANLLLLHCRVKKNNLENMKKLDLYKRLKNGEPLNMYNPDFAPAIADMITSRRINHKINNEFHEIEDLPPLFAELMGKPFEEGTAIMPPCYIDMGKNIKIGKQVFINHNCTCMTAGSITIGPCDDWTTGNSFNGKSRF